MITAFSNASAHAAVGEASNGAGRTVKFHDGTVVPALGQGSWHLAQGRRPEAVEEEALRSWHLAQGRRPEAVEEEALRKGLSLGMTLIDTAEIYSDGRSEELINRVIAGQRERVSLVSKVPPIT
jgi:aryl-alcohol dehydrogenase-like predicted oxidoreductase